MLYEQVRFVADRAETGPGPVRLDVTLFLGCLDVAAGAVPPAALQDAWRRAGYLAHHEVAREAQDLIDRPVPVASVAEAETLFALDRRVDRTATIRSGSVSGPLDALDAPFAVTRDGRMQEISLVGAPSDLPGLAAILDERLVGVSVVAEAGRLVLSRVPSTTAGTLSVLEYPALGFASSMHVRATPVATAMGAALRQFFDMGGSRAVIVSLGPPPAVLAEAEERARTLARLLDVPSAGVIDPSRFSADFKAPHVPARERSGLTHLFGAEAVGQLVLPDLLDLVSGPRAPTPALPDGPPPRAGFAPCLPPGSVSGCGQTVAISEARPDAAGQALWTAAVGRVTTFLGRHRRDVGLIAAAPDAREPFPASPHLTLAAPWVKTPESTRLPGGVMGADAVFAGHLARHLQGPAPYGSVAARPLQQVRTVAPSQPVPGLCRIVKGPRDFRLSNDVTSDPGGLWSSGPARRIMARLLKEADRMGALVLFEPISDALMARVASVFAALLDDVRRAGGLIPSDSDQGYTVVCNRTNNTAQDRESGRLRAEVGFRPAPSISMMVITLSVGAEGGPR